MRTFTRHRENLPTVSSPTGSVQFLPSPEDASNLISHAQQNEFSNQSSTFMQPTSNTTGRQESPSSSSVSNELLGDPLHSQLGRIGYTPLGYLSLSSNESFSTVRLPTTEALEEHESASAFTNETASSVHSLHLPLHLETHHSDITFEPYHSHGNFYQPRSVDSLSTDTYQTANASVDSSMDPMLLDDNSTVTRFITW